MDLPERLAADLDDGFAVLVEEYAGAVYSLTLRLSGPGAAEDLTQETFVRAFVALGGYGPDRIRTLALRPWVVTIALNVVRNRARTVARHPVLPLDGDRVGGDAAFDASDLRAVLEAALARLPLPARQAVVLRHVLGFDTTETAMILGRPVGTVKAQVARGLARMRHELELAGIGKEDTT